MPQGKGTYGSKVGRPPKKPALRKPKPAPKKPATKKKSGFAAVDEKLSKFATGGPIRRGLVGVGRKLTGQAKPKAKPKAAAKKKSVGTKTTVRGGKVAKVVRGGKTIHVGYGRQSQSTKQKPQSGVSKVTPKPAPRGPATKKPKLNPKLGPEVSLKPKPRNRSRPIAPKNQKAKGRAIAKNASKPRAVAKPKAKPRTRART